jgi:hypothetical protein
MVIKFSKVGWFLAMFFLLILGFNQCEMLDNELENRKLKRAREALHLELNQLNDRNGNLMYQNKLLRLSQTELQVLIPGLKQEIEGLNIELKRTKQVSQTHFVVDTLFHTVLRDSTVQDSVKAKSVFYSDDYFHMQGLIIGDLATWKLSYQDTLVQVVFRGKRIRPWLWIFSRRQLMQRIQLKNPQAQIHYSEIIQIK